jgi:hypothetical protein
MSLVLLKLVIKSCLLVLEEKGQFFYQMITFVFEKISYGLDNSFVFLLLIFVYMSIKNIDYWILPPSVKISFFPMKNT